MNSPANSPVTTLALVLLVGLGLGYWYGNQSGYQKAQTDIKTQQEELVKKAAEEATKAANPFKAVNPLEKVETNPFEKAQKALNPF